MFQSLLSLALALHENLAERRELARDLVVRVPEHFAKSVWWWVTDRTIIPHDVEHVDYFGRMLFRLYQWLP